MDPHELTLACVFAETCVDFGEGGSGRPVWTTEETFVPGGPSEGPSGGSVMDVRVAYETYTAFRLWAFEMDGPPAWLPSKVKWTPESTGAAALKWISKRPWIESKDCGKRTLDAAAKLAAGRKGASFFPIRRTWTCHGLLEDAVADRALVEMDNGRRLDEYMSGHRMAVEYVASACRESKNLKDLTRWPMFEHSDIAHAAMAATVLGLVEGGRFDLALELAEMVASIMRATEEEEEVLDLLTMLMARKVGTPGTTVRASAESKRPMTRMCRALAWYSAGRHAEAVPLFEGLISDRGELMRVADTRRYRKLCIEVGASFFANPAGPSVGRMFEVFLKTVASDNAARVINP